MTAEPAWTSGKDTLSRRPMRLSQTLGLLTVLAAGGVFAARAYERSARDPFAFGLLRAGRRFATVDDEIARYGPGRMSCDSIPGGFRVCRASTDGPPGRLVAVVDDRGFIVVLDQQVTDTTPKMEALTRDVVESWDSVATGSRDQEAVDGIVTRWVSSDRRWSATMVVNRSSKTAKDVMLIDEQALAHMDDHTLPALLVLARLGLVRETALDSVDRRAPGALGRASDSLASVGRPLARAAARLPLCAPEPAVNSSGGAEPGTDTADRLGPVGAEIARQAVAAVFPGHHLLLLDQAVLADDAGANEVVSVTAPVPTSDPSIWAFTLTWHARVAAVRAGAEHFGAPPCRAPAEIIVATVDTATNAVTAVRHAPLESDALASRASEARIIYDTDGSPELAVHWVGEYASADWYGEVEWLSVVTLDSLRTVGRRPYVMVRTDKQERTTAVQIGESVYREESEDPVKAYSVAGKRVVTVETGQGRPPRMTQLVMPTPIDGLPSGWLLMPLL